MEEILEPTEQFPFDKLTLTKPTVIAGGNYFIKFLQNGNPLYIQPPKCLTKQGIAKAGKRFYCDFVYKNENEAFIQWLEKLETFSQTAIFDNRDKWFESELSMHDIENSFTSPLKIYKSGKSYILRTNIPTRLGICSLKIYDEDEMDIEPESIKDGTQVITILEVQGIKCSARSFQIEIEAKQILVLKPSKLFDKCILTSLGKSLNTDISSSMISKDVVTTTAASTKDAVTTTAASTKDAVTTTAAVTKDAVTTTAASTKDAYAIVIPDILEDDVFSVNELKMPQIMEKKSDQVLEPVVTNGLLEIELDLDDVLESDTFQLRNRKDVYYTMYRDAKKKAKIARDLALSSYLEAKRIKNTYMLDDVSGSESEDEIEEDDDDETYDIDK